MLTLIGSPIGEPVDRCLVRLAGASRVVLAAAVPGAVVRRLFD